MMPILLKQISHWESAMVHRRRRTMTHFPFKLPMFIPDGVAMSSRGEYIGLIKVYVGGVEEDIWNLWK